MGGYFYSSLPFALVHEYLTFICSFLFDMTSFYSSVTGHVFTSVLLDEIYQFLPMIKC